MLSTNSDQEGLLLNKIWPKDDSTEQSHFILLAIVVALSTMANSIVAPLLPLYARQILATPGQVGLLVSVFGITRFATQPILGMFSDRLGHRRLVQIMLALFAISGVGYGMSNSLLSLLLFRCRRIECFGSILCSWHNNKRESRSSKWGNFIYAKRWFAYRTCFGGLGR
jgi:MFS family permease